MGYEERYLFYARLAGLVWEYWENQKNRINENDPGASAKRADYNRKCLDELRRLHRYYFGVKNEPHCSDCNYYTFWEKKTFGEDVVNDE